jgi:hypothetical protein
MFNRPVALLLSAVAMAFGSAASAQDAYFVRGSGALPCSEALVVAQQQGPGLVALVAWADGALSTVNRMRSDTYDLLPFEEPRGLITQLALNICQQNPAIPFETALHRVFAALEPLRVVSAAESVKMTAGAASVSLRPETLTRVQERLIALGHLQGTADGAYGPATGAALRKFQAAATLPESGLPDVETVLRLLLGA